MQSPLQFFDPARLLVGQTSAWFPIEVLLREVLISSKAVRQVKESAPA